jgi:hypothetical protein
MRSNESSIHEKSESGCDTRSTYRRKLSLEENRVDGIWNGGWACKSQLYRALLSRVDRCPPTELFRAILTNSAHRSFWTGKASDKCLPLTDFAICCIQTHYNKSSCDEPINSPRSPADCPRSRNGNETESLIGTDKAQNWAVESQGKNTSLNLFHWYSKLSENTVQIKYFPPDWIIGCLEVYLYLMYCHILLPFFLQYLTNEEHLISSSSMKPTP